MMNGNFITIALEDLVVGEELPVAIYLHIDFRFITFRGVGDKVDRASYEKFEARKLQHLFVKEEDRKKFLEWSETKKKALSRPEIPEEAKPLEKARVDAHRKMLDIFQAEHPDKEVDRVMSVSKRLVNKVMELPIAVQSLKNLQGYSPGVADHSVNVSILATYLAMNMGYESAPILQRIGLGALLHDIGKTMITIEESDKDADIEKKMLAHPATGAHLMAGAKDLPKEVLMIIEQHHENFDGSGFPKKLRGAAIYDLARIVSIANTFDELVGDGMGSLADRQRAAILKLDQDWSRRFDPQKLDKALRILKLGI